MSNVLHNGILSDELISEIERIKMKKNDKLKDKKKFWKEEKEEACHKEKKDEKKKK